MNVKWTEMFVKSNKYSLNMCNKLRKYPLNCSLMSTKLIYKAGD